MPIESFFGWNSFVHQLPRWRFYTVTICYLIFIKPLKYYHCFVIVLMDFKSKLTIKVVVSFFFFSRLKPLFVHLLAYISRFWFFFHFTLSFRIKAFGRILKSPISITWKIHNKICRERLSLINECFFHLSHN